MTALHAVYIAATIFGAGVTVVDMIGVLGSQSGEDAEGDGDSAGDDGDGGADGEIDGADDAPDGGDDVGEAADDGEGSDEGSEGDEHPSVVAHDLQPRSAQKWIIRSLSALRTLVYFSLGFGPVGWFALTRYPAAATTLAWSIPSGAVVMVGARLLRRLLRRELDSQVTASDMLMEAGEVTVSIPANQLGKVRIRVGGTYVERFARARDPQVAIRVGTSIRVVDVSDECVYVEEQ